MPKPRRLHRQVAVSIFTGQPLMPDSVDTKPRSNGQSEERAGHARVRSDELIPVAAAGIVQKSAWG
jgi:hypothetical protein